MDMQSLEEYINNLTQQNIFAWITMIVSDKKEERYKYIWELLNKIYEKWGVWEWFDTGIWIIKDKNQLFSVPDNWNCTIREKESSLKDSLISIARLSPACLVILDYNDDKESLEFLIQLICLNSVRCIVGVSKEGSDTIQSSIRNFYRNSTIKLSNEKQDIIDWILS